jgi:hypothetical protein
MKFSRMQKLRIICFVIGLFSIVHSQTQKEPKPVDPIKAILKFFENRPLVALDEGRHRNAQTHKFILDLIRNPKFAEKVNDIVVEFGASRYQDVMDKYVNGEDVPFDKLRLVWRETTQVYVFDNPVYQKFFAAVREVNLKLPKDRRLRVLLGEPPIEWSQVNNFNDWAQQSPRDNFAADLIEREVLKKNRHALIIYGGFGHLQRRDVYANFQPTPEKYAGLLELVERKNPGMIYNIWANSATDDLGVPESKKVFWKKPSLIILKGTTLGARDFTTILSAQSLQNERRVKYVNGKSVPISKEAFAKFRLEDNFDALLYLGPIDSITLVPDALDTYADESYYLEVVRRSKALNETSLEDIENLRKKYLESPK